MATTQIERGANNHAAREPAQRDYCYSPSRDRSAVGALLVSAAFYPNGPVWNSVGQAETHNWAGSIGAGVAATLLQAIGLAAYLVLFCYSARPGGAFGPAVFMLRGPGSSGSLCLFSPLRPCFPFQVFIHC